MLAPILFNFYINKIIDNLRSTDLHVPKIQQQCITILLYANDAVSFMQMMPVVLRRAFSGLFDFCT